MSFIRFNGIMATESAHAELEPIERENGPVLVWARLDVDCMPDLDHDDLPVWLDNEIREIGLETVVGVDDWWQWAIEHGLHGEQWVLLLFDAPVFEYLGRSDYGGEWELCTDMHVIASEPVADGAALAYWSGWLQHWGERPGFGLING
jgi:hypothetical protein